jgi:hypothetical protein
MPFKGRDCVLIKSTQYIRKLVQEKLMVKLRFKYKSLNIATLNRLQH